jgi:DNA replication protein DnaC
MKEHHRLEGLRTLDLSLRIDRTKKIITLNTSNIQLDEILGNQLAIMQALIDIINEMQSPTSLQKIAENL